MTDITPKELRSLRERITFEVSRDSGPIRQELEDALCRAADQLERQAWSLVLGWTYNANRVTHWMPIPPPPPEVES